MDGVDVIYWINLDRSKARRRKMERVLQDSAFKRVKRIRFPAIDGESANLDNFIRVPQRTMSNSEYACLVSHLEVIRQFSEQTTHRTALIFEDDVTLEYKPQWKQTSVRTILQGAPSDWDCVMLAYMSNELPEQLYTLNRDAYWSTLAYVINVEGAKKLIADTYYNGKYVLDPLAVSHEADRYIFTKLTTYVYKYPMFIYQYNETSTLHNQAIAFHDASKKRIDDMYGIVRSKNGTTSAVLRWCCGTMALVAFILGTVAFVRQRCHTW